MKDYRLIGILEIAVSILSYAAAYVNLIDQRTVSMGRIWLGFATLWLAMGFIYIRKSKHIDNDD